MSHEAAPTPPPGGQFLVYQTEDGKLKLDVRMTGDTVWLTLNQLEYRAPFQSSARLSLKGPGRCHGLSLRCPFGTPNSANGAYQFQPRATPWDQGVKPNQALKGRTNRCPNPSRVCTSISFSAPNTANDVCMTPCVIHCIDTWRRSCRIWVALPSSSIPSKTTFIFYSNWAGLSQSAQPWKRSRRLPQNGSRPRAMNLPRLHGRPDMGLSRFRNPMSLPSAITSPGSKSTIGRNHFKTSIGPSLNVTGLFSTSDMSGTNPPIQGLNHLVLHTQGVALGCDEVPLWGGI